jgi:hypothetical protein
LRVALVTSQHSIYNHQSNNTFASPVHRAPTQAEPHETAIPAPAEDTDAGHIPDAHLLHCNHAGPSACVTTEPNQPPRRHRDLPVLTLSKWRRDGGRWRGRKGKGSGRKRCGTSLLAASQPGLIARSGGVSVNVFIGGGSGYTKLKARRAARGGTKKQQGQQRPASSSIVMEQIMGGRYTARGM